MDSFLFAISAVAPIVLTVLIGYCLRRTGMMNEQISRATNRLVFRLFLPVMLFSNIYKLEGLGSIDGRYMLFALVLVLAVYLLAIPLVLLVTKEASRRGVLLQGVFRSNFALIGVPLAAALFGEEGAIVASLLSAIVIPTFNILAVVSLSVFGERRERVRVGRILLGILKNPLIDGIAAGFLVLGVRALFLRWGVPFRLSDIGPLMTVIDYLGRVATPLALLTLGAQFTFSAVRSLRREIVFGTLMRTLAVPALGLGAALLFRDVFSGAHFAAFVAMLTTPVAVSTVPMAQEMGADDTLAGQLVVWSTLFSALTIFAASFFLKFIGIF